MAETEKNLIIQKTLNSIIYYLSVGIILNKILLLFIAVADQSTSASWWQQDTINAADIADNTDFFSSTHGLVQTHPSLNAGDSINPIRFSPGSAPAASSRSKHLDYRQSATAELRRNPNLSAPDECARACREGEPPRICYYHFTLEYYTVLGA